MPLFMLPDRYKLTVPLSLLMRIVMADLALFALKFVIVVCFLPLEVGCFLIMLENRALALVLLFGPFFLVLPILLGNRSRPVASDKQHSGCNRGKECLHSASPERGSPTLALHVRQWMPDRKTRLTRISFR